MVKKAIIITAAAFLLGVLLFGRSAVSYVRTSAGYVKESVRDAVPMEFEIKRARNEIDNLLPEVRKNMYVIAKEEVEVQNLDNQVAEAQARLAKEKGDILQLTSDLQTGNNVFRYAGRSYSADQVQVDVANRFKRYKTGEATLASLQQILAARQQSLEAARQKLEGMLAAKQQLKVEVENLEARLQMVSAAKATNECQFDDSRLGQVRELVSNLRTRLDVAERLVNAETQFHGEIPLDEPVPEDIVNQVTDYFSTGGPSASALAAE